MNDGRGDGGGASSFTCGFLLGATLGAMGALLLAPSSGAQLRSGLDEGRRRLSETGTRTVTELRESRLELRDAYERAHAALSDAARDLKAAVRSVMEPPPASGGSASTTPGKEPS